MSDRKNKIALAGQIRAKRALHGLKQSDIKRMVKLSQPTIVKIEKGCTTVKFENYYTVLDALNRYKP